MHVLVASMMFSLSSVSFAELIINPSSGNDSQATLSWSSEQADQFLNGDLESTSASTQATPESYVAEPTPPGSTKITTTVRSSNGVAPASAAPKTVRILDTSAYSSQPSVNARAALVMDAQTGEVLYSKNTNVALPIASDQGHDCSGDLRCAFEYV